MSPIRGLKASMFNKTWRLNDQNLVLTKLWHCSEDVAACSGNEVSYSVLVVMYPVVCKSSSTCQVELGM